MVSPEEEADTSYLIIDYYYFGRFMFIMTTCITLSGLYYSAIPHYIDENYYSNRTKWVMENYETYPNGSMYYDFVNEDGTVSHGELGAWFARMLKGEVRFAYGNSFWNYCKPRTIPNINWMTSIVRSMNHMVIVQVLFRAAVLLSITHSLFQCVLIKNIASFKKSPMLRHILAYPLIFVELVHNVCLFFISCIHYEQDDHMVPITRVSLVLVTMTTVLKLLFSATLSPNRYIQTACILLSSAVIFSHNNVIDDYDTFLKEPFCDSSAQPIVVYSQLFYFFAFFICGYVQNKSMENIHIVTSSTEEEREYERRLGMGTDKPIPRLFIDSKKGTEINIS